MKWKVFQLAAEIIQEVTTWLTLWQWIILLISIGIWAAVFVPLIVG